MQRYLMRLRRNFNGALKITFAADKSKVGRYQTTLAYVYNLDREIGAMLPPQAMRVVASCVAHFRRRALCCSSETHLLCCRALCCSSETHLLCCRALRCSSEAHLLFCHN